MNRTQKSEVVENLKNRINDSDIFYLIDESTLDAGKTSDLRRAAFAKGIKYTVVKNTLIKIALEQSNKEVSEDMYNALKGPTAVFFTSNANDVAKLVKDFRGDKAKPELKAAYIDTEEYIGDGQLDTLVNLKSKTDLIAEVISLLQSPTKNVISALQSNAGPKVASLLKALEEK